MNPVEITNDEGEKIGTAVLEKGESSVEQETFMLNLMKLNTVSVQQEIARHKLTRKEVIDLLLYAMSYPMFQPEKIKMKKIENCLHSVEECLKAKMWLIHDHWKKEQEPTEEKQEMKF